MEQKTMTMQKEPDMEMVFDMLKEKMPIPEEMKDAVLNVFTYVLSM